MSEQYTPMMQAYLKTKEEYKDSILFYRLGDFYEMFFEDAITVTKELELVLTGKSCGMKEKAPMCGVPFHSADTYINRLVELGYKVAICEQVEDPKLAKGIVKREVIRVVTPGTNINDTNDSSVFLCCLIKSGEDFGIAVTDVGTGEFIIHANQSEEKVKEYLIKIAPKEIIVNDGAHMVIDSFVSMLNEKPSVYNISHITDDLEDSKEFLIRHFNNGFSELQNSSFSLGIIAAANLLGYLYDTQKNDLSHINKIQFLDDGGILKIDAFTFRNLELIDPLRREDKKGSLFYCLDNTNTSMGRRLLKSYIRYPLTVPSEINERLDAIEDLNKDRVLAEELKEILRSVYDLERILSKVSFKTANPRDLLALKGSIKDFHAIKHLLSEMSSKALKRISKDLDSLEDIYKLIDDAISEDAPVSLHDADIIRVGYSVDCDTLKKASTNGKSLLIELCDREKEKTGIKNLKINYSRVFGYFFEVTNSFLNEVPDYFIRRQTLANCERFFTEELKSLEDTILGAKEKLDRLEYDLYQGVLNTIFSNIDRIQKSAHLIAMLDVFLSFSETAVKNHYVRPNLNKKGYIKISGGRHPVVEMMQKDNLFIDNDCYLDNADHQIYLITGPNMAGKSTYMRQCALMVIMAQMGSFVPAKSADIGICDRVFTRVGASDDLSSGQSTFMVEMNEMANILKNATKDSLIILDEIGRGTSTYDGLSIAWAVIEHIANKKILGAKTLFATHYHELTSLEGSLKGVKNYSIAVREDGDKIIFLRKIIDKAADKSYGIQVAALAGVPTEVTDRAKEILEEIVKGTFLEEKPEIISGEMDNQLSFFDMIPNKSPVEDEIKSFDLNNATPIMALNFLNELKSRYGL